MAIEVRCQDCQADYKISDEKAGMRFKCKKCGSLVRIPTTDEPPAGDDSDKVAEPSTAGTWPSFLPIISWLVAGIAGIGVFAIVWASWNKPSPPDPPPGKAVGPASAKLVESNAPPAAEPPAEAVPVIPLDPVNKLQTAAEPLTFYQACRRARSVYLKERAVTAEFVDLLRQVADKFPEIEVGTDRDAPVWQTLTLDSRRAGLDGFRFRSPLDVPADFYWALTFQKRYWKWGILPMEGEMEDFSNPYQQQDVEYQDAGLLPETTLYFQSLQGGLIEPGKEYLIYFIPGNYGEFELTSTIQLCEAGTNNFGDSAEAYAQSIGLKRRMRAAPPGSRLLTGHKGSVTGVAFLDDQTLLSSGVDGTIHVWDPETDSATQVWPSEAPTLDGLALLDDGRMAAAHSRYGMSISLFDTQSGELIDRLPGHGSSVAATAPAGDPQRLLAFYSSYADAERTKGVTGMLEILNPSDRRDFLRFNIDGFSVYDMAAVPGTDLVVLVGEASTGPNEPDAKDGVQFVASMQNGRVLNRTPRGKHAISSVWVAEDGSRMTTMDYVGHISSCRLPDMDDRIERTQDEVVVACAPFPDGLRLAMVGYGGSVRIWNTHRGWMEFNRQASTEPLTSVAVSPNGRWIATGGQDAAVRLWDTEFDPFQEPDPALATRFNNSLGMPMKLIPAGTFQMGTVETGQTHLLTTDIKSEQPRHEVQVSQPFYLGIHEVTVGQFAEFVEATGYVTDAERTGKGHHTVDMERWMESRPEYTWRTPGFEQQPEHPVVQVSWNDAIAFCNWLSEQEGATYRLPTEAEWEYACRAGTQSLWSAHESAVQSTANVGDWSLNQAYSGTARNADRWYDNYAFTAPVGRFPPNASGLHDMQGNVFEWCADWYDETYYASGDTLDPLGPNSGIYRVMRGGAFFYPASYCRPAYRGMAEPNFAYSSDGFRVVRDVSPHPPSKKQEVSLEDFLGVWEGKWDNRFRVRITATAPQDPDEGDADLIYEWEERLEQPMERSEGHAKIEDGKLLFGAMEFMPNPLNPERCSAIGHFRERRTASLKRQSVSATESAEN